MNDAHATLEASPMMHANERDIALRCTSGAN